MSRLRRTASPVAVIVAAIIAVLGLSASAAQADPSAPPGTPTAVNTTSVPTAGPLFFGALVHGHGCSASVVKSPGHNLILTAAHCVKGTGAGIRFVPGYLNGTIPYGVWTTTKAWLDPKWLKTQNPQDDFAFLQVAPQSVNGQLRNVEDLVGGNLLGIAPPAGTTVTDVAYPSGVNDAPITCTNQLIYTSGYPTFNCYGYYGGTSGSPFLVKGPRGRTFVTGVIGGLNQGGCYDWNSFSSAFGLDPIKAYLRAVLGRPADVAPQAGSDGC